MQIPDQVRNDVRGITEVKGANDAMRNHRYERGHKS